MFKDKDEKEIYKKLFDKLEKERINDYFEIYEWRKQEFVRVDKK